MQHITKLIVFVLGSFFAFLLPSCGSSSANLKPKQLEKKLTEAFHNNTRPNFVLNLGQKYQEEYPTHRPQINHRLKLIPEQEKITNLNLYTVKPVWKWNDGKYHHFLKDGSIAKEISDKTDVYRFYLYISNEVPWKLSIKNQIKIETSVHRMDNFALSAFYIKLTTPQNQFFYDPDDATFKDKRKKGCSSIWLQTEKDIFNEKNDINDVLYFRPHDACFKNIESKVPTPKSPASEPPPPTASEPTSPPPTSSALTPPAPTPPQSTSLESKSTDAESQPVPTPFYIATVKIKMRPNKTTFRVAKLLSGETTLKPYEKNHPIPLNSFISTPGYGYSTTVGEIQISAPSKELSATTANIELALKGCQEVAKQQIKIHVVKGTPSVDDIHNMPTTLINMDDCFNKITLAEKEIPVKMPLHTNKNTVLFVDPYKFNCKPGVQLNGETYWLNKINSTPNIWTFPLKSELSELKPDTRLNIISKPTGMTATTEGQLACGNEEILTHVTIADVVKTGLTLPIARPVLIYILRDITADQTIGATNAKMFWHELLEIVEETIANRMYVVRHKSSFAGFETLRAPSDFFPRENFNFKELAKSIKNSDNSPSLNQVVADAFQLVEDFKRSGTSLAADVVILSSNSLNCQIVKKPIKNLAAPPDKKTKMRIRLLGNNKTLTTDNVINLPSGKKAFAENCDISKDVAIRFTNIREAAEVQDPNFQLFPKDNWTKVLQELNSPN